MASYLMLLAISALAVTASPVPDVNAEVAGLRREVTPPPSCTTVTSYQITNQYAWKSPFKQLPYSCTSNGDNAECQLSAQYGVSTGVSIEVGFNLGLSFEEIFDVGIDTSVTYETDKEFEVGVTLACPGSLECGFFQQDSIQIVQGNQITTEICSSDSDPKVTTNYYEVNFPQVDSSGYPISTFDICLCPGQSQSLPEAAGLYVCQNSC
jgi:opacity protein-like surface antigen